MLYQPSSTIYTASNSGYKIVVHIIELVFQIITTMKLNTGDY